MSRGVGHRHGLNPALPWLWRGPAAVALIGPLAWEPPYAMDEAQKRQKKKRKASPFKRTQKIKIFRNKVFLSVRRTENL